MMSAWMTRPENINTPYPSIAERHTFVAVGGITDRQVLDWFSNNRKRHRKVLRARRSACAVRRLLQQLRARNREPTVAYNNRVANRSGNTWSRATRPRLQDGARKRRG
jgi:Homeobox KN domain